MLVTYILLFINIKINHCRIIYGLEIKKKIIFFSFLNYENILN